MNIDVLLSRYVAVRVTKDTVNDRAEVTVELLDRDGRFGHGTGGHLAAAVERAEKMLVDEKAQAQYRAGRDQPATSQGETGTDAETEQAGAGRGVRPERGRARAGQRVGSTAHPAPAGDSVQSDDGGRRDDDGERVAG